VVLQLRGFRFYSLTGIDFLRSLIDELHAYGHLIVIADAEPSQRHVVERTGLLAAVGEENVIWRQDIIGEAATMGVARATAWHTHHQDAAAGPGPQTPADQSSD
jgi:hypothetical protein